MLITDALIVKKRPACSRHTWEPALPGAAAGLLGGGHLITLASHRSLSSNRALICARKPLS